MTDEMLYGLPASIHAIAEFDPVEDIVLPIVRHALPDVNVSSTIPPVGSIFPWVMIRADGGRSEVTGDGRFTERANVIVHVFTNDPEGDKAGAILSDAVRVALRDFHKFPGTTALRTVTRVQRPTRVPDWATGQGPVQYADLPSDAWRYESVYRIVYRRPGT